MIFSDNQLDELRNTIAPRIKRDKMFKELYQDRELFCMTYEYLLKDCDSFYKKYTNINTTDDDSAICRAFTVFSSKMIPSIMKDFVPDAIAFLHNPNKHVCENMHSLPVIDAGSFNGFDIENILSDKLLDINYRCYLENRTLLHISYLLQYSKAINNLVILNVSDLVSKDTKVYKQMFPILDIDHGHSILSKRRKGELDYWLAKNKEVIVIFAMGSNVDQRYQTLLEDKMNALKKPIYGNKNKDSYYEHPSNGICFESWAQSIYYQLGK